MVKVLYPTKTNAWLGGKLFIKGECTFNNVEEGIGFAKMLNLKYELIEDEKSAKKPSKRKVKADGQ